MLLKKIKYAICILHLFIFCEFTFSEQTTKNDHVNFSKDGSIDDANMLQETSQVNEIESSVMSSDPEFNKEEIIEHSKELELDKIYDVEDKWIKFEVKEDFDISLKKFHLVEVKGAGPLLIKVKKNSTKHMITHKLEIDDAYEMSYIPINTHLYLRE